MDAPSRARRRERERRHARRRRGVVWAIRVVALAAVLVLGIAIGMAVEQTPKPGGSQTLVRTLEPTTVTPPETVTVTVSNP